MLVGTQGLKRTEANSFSQILSFLSALVVPRHLKIWATVPQRLNRGVTPTGSQPDLWVEGRAHSPHKKNIKILSLPVGHLQNHGSTFEHWGRPNRNSWKVRFTFFSPLQGSCGHGASTTSEKHAEAPQAMFSARSAFQSSTRGGGGRGRGDSRR